MKILLAVHFIKSLHSACDVFIRTWDNFLKFHKKDLECDVVFVSGGHSTDELQSIAPNCDKAYMPNDWVCTASNEFVGGSTRYGGALNVPTILDAEGYDYVMRIDHDAFTTYDSINQICKFLRANPTIDFLSPTNDPRGICFSHPLMVKLYKETKIVNGVQALSYFPFGYPTNNGDLWCIRRDFFLELCEHLKKDPRVPGMPFIMTHFLTYLQDCDLLGVHNSEVDSHPDKEKFMAYADGFLGNDAWTYFCKMKPTAAGVLDKHGRSFLKRNEFYEYGFVLEQTCDYSEIQDPVNTAYPHTLNAQIDSLFHIGSGYCCLFYPEAMKDGVPTQFVGMADSFKSGTNPFWMAHYSLYKFLLDRFGLPEEKARVEHSMQELFEFQKTDLDMMNSLSQKIIRAYLPAFKEYLG